MSLKVFIFLKCIQRTQNTAPAFIHYMGVNHGGADIALCVESGLGHAPSGVGFAGDIAESVVAARGLAGRCCINRP